MIYVWCLITLGPKPDFCQKITFFTLTSMLNRNSRLILKVYFERYLIDLEAVLIHTKKEVNAFIGLSQFKREARRSGTEIIKPLL